MLICHIDLDILIRHFLQKLDFNRNFEYSLRWSILFYRSITIYLLLRLCICSVFLWQLQGFLKSIHIIVAIDKCAMKCTSKTITVIAYCLIHFRNNTEVFFIGITVAVFSFLCISFCYLWTVDIMIVHVA
jgi:hypothetical protein